MHSYTNDRLPTVLLVDDEADILFVLEQGLIEYGFTVRTATSAEQAVAALRDGVVDFVLSDVSMPGKDGLWLFEYVHRHHPALVDERRFLFLTGNVTSIETVAERHGITVLQKPAGFECIVAAIEAAGLQGASSFVAVDRPFG